MNEDFYIEIMGCVLITAVTGLVVGLTIWYANFVYHDMSEKRRWRKRR